MDVKRTGSFIAEMRKGKNMTQAELAAKLQVTDKAVSRWERGVGYPDITLLEPLAGQRRQAVRRVILLAIVMLIGAAMLIWGILWWTSQQSALKIIAGADGPSAVFVAWRGEPMLPVAVSAAGAVLILASLLIYRWRK